MRQLTVKQKKFLVEWANKNQDIMEKTSDYILNMETKDWEVLQKMNDTENLYQNCNRFLDDLEAVREPILGEVRYFENK